MTTHNVTKSKEFAQAVAAAKANDIIQLGEGVRVRSAALPDMVFDPKTPVTFTSKSETNRGVLEGLLLNMSGKGNFATLKGGKQQQGVVFDSVIFSAPKSDKFKLPSGDVVTLKKAVGWRCDANWPEVNPLTENAGMQALALGSGAKNITVRNSLIEGYANAFKVNGADSLTIEHCDFLRNCEDMIKLWSGSNIAILYCRQGEFDGLDYDDAHKIGWDKDGPATGGVPVHSDFIQVPGGIEGLIIKGCVVYDDTVRVHGILLNNPSDQDLRDVSITDCRFDITHTTAVIAKKANNFEFCRNKVVRLREVPDALKGKNDTRVEISGMTGKVVVTDNECRKFWLDDVGVGTVERNTVTNDAMAGFEGYVELRPEKVKEGEEHAGRKLGEPSPAPEEPPVEPPIEPTKPDVTVTEVKSDGAGGWDMQLNIKPGKDK